MELFPFSDCAYHEGWHAFATICGTKDNYVYIFDIEESREARVRLDPVKLKQWGPEIMFVRDKLYLLYLEHKHQCVQVLDVESRQLRKLITHGNAPEKWWKLSEVVYVKRHNTIYVFMQESDVLSDVLLYTLSLQSLQWNKVNTDFPDDFGMGRRDSKSQDRAVCTEDGRYMIMAGMVRPCEEEEESTLGYHTVIWILDLHCMRVCRSQLVVPWSKSWVKISVSTRIARVNQLVARFVDNETENEILCPLSIRQTIRKYVQFELLHVVSFDLHRWGDHWVIAVDELLSDCFF